MLAVVGDRFPRTGAIAMSIMGGIGMMSAGLIGGPGLGYAKDRFTGEHLTTTAPAIYEQYKAATPSKFLFLKSARTRRHEAGGSTEGADEDARAAGRGRRQHRRRPRNAEGRFLHSGGDGRRSTCCCSSTSKPSAATSRCTSTKWARRPIAERAGGPGWSAG